MSYQNNEHRSQPRIPVELPATISIGSQLTLKGYLRDLSLASAFVRIKNNVYLNINDEVGITIQCSQDDANEVVQAEARISRIVPGEGFAVYFTKLDDNSMKCLKKILPKTGL